MRLRVYLLVLLFMFLCSLLSVGLLLTYMDIERNLPVGYASMGLAVFLAMSSALALIIFFIKRVIERGEVFVHTVNSSLRQGMLLSVGVMSLLVFHKLNILTWQTGLLLTSALLFIEMLSRSISHHAE